jgi:hypothetical protein
MNKIRLHEVLTLVAALKRETQGLSQSEAFKIAWASLKLQRALKQGIVQFQYMKKNGTLRTAFGTLCPEILGQAEPQNATESCANVNQKYYDTEANGWRCFKRVLLQF